MISPLRIAIVGLGTGGQAASLFLQRDGHTVDVSIATLSVPVQQ